MHNRFSYLFALPVLLLLHSAPAVAEQIICPDIDAAEQGSALDEYALGRAYDEGYCKLAVSKHDAEYWYGLAAAKGHTLAQYQLAETYFTGDGVATDYPKAKKWYTAAALQDHGLSQLRLAFLNAEAHFEPLKTDYIEAEKWFTKAAEKNAGDAQFRLGNFYNNYKNPPDYGKGFIWLKRAALGGHRVAMFDLSRMFMDGRGVARNQELALEWLRKSADADLLQAQMTLVEMFSNGVQGVEKNPREALRWVLKIAAKPTASVFYLNRAGDIFFDGWEGMQKNYPTARKYYERAAAKEDKHALERLVQIYTQGLGVATDPAKVEEYRAKIKP